MHRQLTLPRFVGLTPLLVSFLFVSATANSVIAANPPNVAPRFVVPGHDREMRLLEEMFLRHYQDPVLRGVATLWDGWIPMSSLWPATTPAVEGDEIRAHWRRTLLGRFIDDEGYVSTHQHIGTGHKDGWPFPLWTQAGGIGFHFSVAGMPFGKENGIVRTDSLEGWEIHGANVQRFDDNTGVTLTLAEPNATLTTPRFVVDTFVAPFLRIEYVAEGLPLTARPYIEWTTIDAPTFSPERRIYFALRPIENGLGFEMLPVFKVLSWKGKVTQFRIGFDNPGSARVTIKSLITAIDTRHTINNFVYLQGCSDYLRWTGDLNFLRQNIARMRLALRYALFEFSIRSAKCVVTPWVGHDGRTGLQRHPDGSKTILPGRGVGNNYWDLLPFGGEDALATIYAFDAIRRFAELEQTIAIHPDWSLPAGPLRFDPGELDQWAAEIRATAGVKFWNDAAGRFVAAIDQDKVAHDFGFTFLNCEAIYYGFATDSQARSILQWLAGERIVEGDTSKGPDIYHWRFAPRATTKRNIEYYMWAWTGPEDLPWGGQVQDGGAVLGFSYHDLMARLQYRGPDDAWQRLKEICDWFGAVQEAGGYRKYYAVAGRGTLQGGGTAGGLGLDFEFVESILVPQTLLYGFLGLNPRIHAIELNPRLPTAWPSLTVNGIHWQGHVINVTASSQSLTLDLVASGTGNIRIHPVPGEWAVEGSTEVIGNTGVLWNPADSRQLRLTRATPPTKPNYCRSGL